MSTSARTKGRKLWPRVSMCMFWSKPTRCSSSAHDRNPSSLSCSCEGVMRPRMSAALAFCRWPTIPFFSGLEDGKQTVLSNVVEELLLGPLSLLTGEDKSLDAFVKEKQAPSYRIRSIRQLGRYLSNVPDEGCTPRTFGT